MSNKDDLKRGRLLILKELLDLLPKLKKLPKMVAGYEVERRKNLPKSEDKVK